MGCCEATLKTLAAISCTPVAERSSVGAQTLYLCLIYVYIYAVHVKKSLINTLIRTLIGPKEPNMEYVRYLY